MLTWSTRILATVCSQSREFTVTMTTSDEVKFRTFMPEWKHGQLINNFINKKLERTDATLLSVCYIYAIEIINKEKL